MKPLRIAFDVGGVLSKYPETFGRLLRALHMSPEVYVYIVSDMHPREKIIEMLEMNGLGYSYTDALSADYATHGERCKEVLCEQLKIDILIDDVIGYVASGKHVRLLVMPDPDRDYYHENWKTDGSEGNFGRRGAGHFIVAGRGFLSPEFATLEQARVWAAMTNRQQYEIHHVVGNAINCVEVLL